MFGVADGQLFVADLHQIHAGRARCARAWPWAGSSDTELGRQVTV